MRKVMKEVCPQVERLHRASVLVQFDDYTKLYTGYYSIYYITQASTATFVACGCFITLSTKAWVGKLFRQKATFSTCIPLKAAVKVSLPKSM